MCSFCSCCNYKTESKAHPLVAAALASGTGLASGNKSGIRPREGGYPPVSTQAEKHLKARLTEHVGPAKAGQECLDGAGLVEVAVEAQCHGCRVDSPVVAISKISSLVEKHGIQREVD